MIGSTMANYHSDVARRRYPAVATCLIRSSLPMWTLTMAPGVWCARLPMAARSPGVKFDLTTSVLRREADAGRVGVLGAHAKPDI
jgi:hypothetical protein